MNTHNTYRDNLRYLIKWLERIDVTVAIRPAHPLLYKLADTWEQFLFFLQAKVLKHFFIKRNTQKLLISELLADYNYNRATHLQKVTSLFEGVKPGKRVRFSVLLWEPMDAGGNLGEMSRIRGGYSPQIVVDHAEATRVFHVLINNVKNEVERILRERK